jgi:hypothetical protein
LTEGGYSKFSENISFCLENDGSMVEERGFDIIIKALKAYYPCDLRIFFKLATPAILFY